MALADVVNEGSTAWLPVSFLDRNGAAEVPSTISYRIDCLTSGKIVKEATSVAPGSSIEITLSATDTAIQDDANSLERKLVTITATYSTGQLQDAFVFVVRNLRKVGA